MTPVEILASQSAVYRHLIESLCPPGQERDKALWALTQASASAMRAVTPPPGPPLVTASAIQEEAAVGIRDGKIAPPGAPVS